MTVAFFSRQQARAWSPHQYQQRAMRFLLQHDVGGLFLDPGLGKTSIVLGVLKILRDKGLFNRALIIAPFRVMSDVWPNELTEWSDFHSLSYSILHGRNKEDAVREDTDIHIINPEGLQWLIQPETLTSATGKRRLRIDAKAFKALGYDVLIVDELSKFKHVTTQRFKMMKPLLGTFARRWGLTGSPAASGLMDLFGQIFMLDMGKTFGKYYSHYRLRYFAPVDFYQRQWVLKAGARDELFQKLAPLALRMSAEEYNQLPPLVVQTLHVELPPKVRDIYERVEERFFAVIGSRALTAANAAVASSKCHQIANGGVYLDQEMLGMGMRPTKQQREVAILHNEKVDALEGLLDELQGQPLLVAYTFEHDLMHLRERFGQDVPYVGGGVSLARSRALMQAWNAGELPFLFAHPQSWGHGVNLQRGGGHVCWFSVPWSFDHYDQYIRRIWRQGQQRSSVFVYHLIARQTVDELIMRTLKGRQLTQQELFTALTEYREKKLAAV